MTLPQQIKNTREKLGLSQRDLAKKMGVPQSTVVRIESGEMNISQATIEKFCEATNSLIAIIPVNGMYSADVADENLILKAQLNKILSIITNL